MVTELQIQVKPRDQRGRHLVIATHSGTVHKHRFDVEDQGERKKFREVVIARFGLPDDAHGWIEDKLVADAAAVDSSGQLWTPNTIGLADVVAQPVHWFWDNYFPEGAVTLLDSDPGEGKSTALVDIAARHSRGNSMPPHTAPDGTYSRGNSLLICGEDDLQRTIKPRLIAANADLHRVHFLRTVSIDGEDERIIQLPGDLPIIERVVVEKQISFIGIDVLGCFIGAGLSMNDDAAMRKVTTPFANMLERTRATSLWLRHLNKKENLRGMYRGGGSIAISAAARAVFAIAPHPEEPGVKVLAPIKHNLGPRPHSLTFTIEAVGSTSRIVWGGQTDLTAADVLKSHEKPSGGSKADAAKGIISEILGQGPRGENEVRTACTEAGVSERTYWRARTSLGVQAEKTDFRGEWLLSMPSANGVCHEDF